MVDEPRYWGSWKGRIIKAIAIDRAQSWSEIRKVTGLSQKALNGILSDLYKINAIYQNPKGTYWVEKDLYDQYLAFFKEKEETVVTPLSQLVSEKKDESNNSRK